MVARRKKTRRSTSWLCPDEPALQGGTHNPYRRHRHLDGNDIADVLKVLVATERQHLPQWVVDDFNQFIAIPERTRGSVLFNVANAFAPWSSELIAEATSASDFDIRNSGAHG